MMKIESEDTMQVKYVAYFRVSTRRQGQSGLGLEAQQQAVESMAARNEATLLCSYTEIESGKSTKRPKLAEAVRHAKLTNSILVVAKLDRLARNFHFLRTLKESKLKFICCDNEHANELTIDLLAVIAEHEAKAIAARTKAALAVVKVRGKKLGSAREGHWEGREDQRRAGIEKGQPLAVAENSRKAQEHYCDFLIPEIKIRREAGASLEQIVSWLNGQGFTTRRGNSFTVTAVWRLIDRYLGKEYLGYMGSKVRPVAACGASA